MAEVWISAAEAFDRVGKATGLNAARRTICSRAHAGLIRAKATRLMWGTSVRDDCFIPIEFWWARGEAALKQNWTTGDFETWIDRKERVLAYGVSFAQSGIEAIIAAAGGASTEAQSSAPNHANVGGRPAAAWWDDLWVEMCRQLYVGDLKPNRQADLVSAMIKWTSERGHDPAESTIRERARKLWNALKGDAGN